LDVGSHILLAGLNANVMEKQFELEFIFFTDFIPSGRGFEWKVHTIREIAGPNAVPVEGSHVHPCHDGAEYIHIDRFFWKHLLNLQTIQNKKLLEREVSKFKNFIEKNTENVGKKFAEEARKIYYGEKSSRPIRGETSESEAKELTDEGIPFSKLPWPSKEDA